ncbi:MAG TPA: TlpA disulfide reductase family protein [Verrucomicrobiae bacterium]|jgi:thiol-disulfide isomerase/thioredoxin
MKLRNLFLAAIVAVFFSLAIDGRADAANDATQSWQALTNFSPAQPPMEWQTNAPTQEQLAKFDDERAAQSAALADGAKDFYTRFPADANVARARVTEIQALQMAVHFGATNRLADLDARERALTQNTNAPEELRYELRLDEIGREMKSASAAGADMSAEMEKAGRELVAEFPGGPEGYQILLDVAQDGDLATMREVGEFMADSGGPADLTDIGKGLLRRADAVGKPLAIAFTAADGRAVNLTTLSNKVVLVDFWATWCPYCVQSVPELKRLYAQYHTNGFEIVGIDFDDDTNAAQKFIKEQNLAWPQFFGGRNGNKFGREYSIYALPSAWLVDRNGAVRDIHAQQYLEAKLKKLLSE